MIAEGDFLRADAQGHEQQRQDEAEEVIPMECHMRLREAKSRWATTGFYHGRTSAREWSADRRRCCGTDRFPIDLNYAPSGAAQ